MTDHQPRSAHSRARDDPLLPAVQRLARAASGAGILLTRRTIEPGRGLWTFPGGFVDHGETATDAAIRETLEETGLTVELAGLLNVFTFPGAPVIVVYRARVKSGTLTPCGSGSRCAGRCRGG